MALKNETEFWSGRKVLITGHAGFKGVWLTLLLEALGAEVYGVSLAPPTEPSLFKLAAARPPKGGGSLMGDIMAQGRLASAFEQSGAEVAFHLAAQPIVSRSYLAPAGTFAVNVMGTVSFLEAARQASALKAAVIATSDKCYRNDGRRGGYGEDDPLGGDDPYSASKAAAELAVGAWRRSCFQDDRGLLATARTGHVLGGGDFAPARLVPDAMKSFTDGRPLILRRPWALRPWQHVLEPLSGHLALARGLYEGRWEWAGAWNFGPDPADHWLASKLAGRLAELWGGGAKVEQAPAPGYQEAEAEIWILNAERARTALNWPVRLPLEEALAWTVDWYRAFYRGWPTLEVVQRQISSYLER
jgi:CDP-glucose 4,6-dehydratase